MNPLRTARLLSLATLVALPSLISSAPAAMLFTQVGAGTTTTTAGAGGAQNVSITPMTINRSAFGFGETGGVAMSTVEGVFYTYTFAVNPDGSNRFDVQNQMNQLWSGWGSPNNGPWQRGPTSSTWNRGVRIQHDYPTTNNATSNPASTVPITLNTSIAPPSAGDTLRVEVYLDAIRNEMDYVFRNLTTGEQFTRTMANADAGVPNTNLSFNNIAFRTDISGGATQFAYTYGTFGVVPEPSRAILLSMAPLALLLRRRR